MAERNVLKYSHPVSEFWKNAASNLDAATSIRRMSKDKIIDSITAGKFNITVKYIFFEACGRV